jgi:hypothetical protein
VLGSFTRFQDQAAKVGCLWSLIQLIGLAEGFQHHVEPVEERYPVIQIAAWERPLCGEGGEMLREEG